MKIKHNENNGCRRILEILTLQCVSNTGRLVLCFFTRGRVRFPKTDEAHYASEIEKTKGFGARIWLTVRLFALDNIYFPVGLAFWLVIILAGLFLLAKLF